MSECIEHSELACSKRKRTPTGSFTSVGGHFCSSDFCVIDWPKLGWLVQNSRISQSRDRLEPIVPLLFGAGLLLHMSCLVPQSYTLT